MHRKAIWHFYRAALHGSNLEIGKVISPGKSRSLESGHIESREDD